MPYLINNILLSSYCHVRYSAYIILTYQQNQGLICSTSEGLPHETLLQNVLKYSPSLNKLMCKIPILSLILDPGPKVESLVTMKLKGGLT